MTRSIWLSLVTSDLRDTAVPGMDSAAPLPRICPPELLKSITA